MDLIGVPLDLGQTVRGTDVGPAAIRYAGLQKRLLALGHDVRDLGNVSVPVSAMVPLANVVSTIARVGAQTRDMVAESRRAGRVPVVLGGDHSVAIGSVAGLLELGSVGLLWIDAHGDFNTPTSSPSGNVHGMPLRVLSGQGYPELLEVCRGRRIDPRRVALVGIRSLDERERTELAEAGILVLTMRDIDEQGIGTVARRALDRVRGPGGVHISLDVDALDPSDAPGVATPVRGGLSYREAHVLMEVLADENLTSSIDIVEVNPMLDLRNRTAETAVELAASALGMAIL